MKKKTMIMTCTSAVLAIAALIIAIIVVPSFMSSSQQGNINELNVSIGDVEEGREGASASNSVSSLGEDIDNTEDSSSIMNVNITDIDNSESSDDNSGDINTNQQSESSVSGDNGVGGRRQSYSQQRHLDTIDKDASIDLATSFIKAFLTFDSASLADGSWRKSILNYVDSALMNDDEEYETNILYQYYSDPQWAKACSTYDKFYSKVLDVSDPWLSSEQDVGYDFDSVMCYVTVKRESTSGLPNNSNYWQSVNIEQTDYCISMTYDGSKIYRVMECGTRVLEEDINNWFDTHSYEGVYPDPPSAFNSEEEKQKAIEEYMKSEGSMY